MHLIMNALEEVTSCAHPNVSEISLLITLMSVSVLNLNLLTFFFCQIEETQIPDYCAHHSSSVPAVFAQASSAPFKDTANTSQLPAAFLTLVI